MGGGAEWLEWGEVGGGVWDQERNLRKGEEVTFGDDREGMGVS